MLPLGLFKRRNFSAGNMETFSMYAGLAVLFFFLILFLQQIGGYTPLQSGMATLPVTAIMFVLSRRFGALADRFGPRFFMGAGPLVAACGLLLFQRIGAEVDYVSEVLPGLLVFALGLSMTVAPLTAAVLAGAETSQAGIASGVNNAIARVAGLLGTAAVGAAVAGSFGSSLDEHLQGVTLGPGRARRGRPGQAPPARAPRCPRPHKRPGERADEGRRAGLTAQLSPRHGDRRPARRRRGCCGSGGDSKPEGRGHGRDLPGGPAGRAPAPRSPRAPPNRAAPRCE